MTSVSKDDVLTYGSLAMDEAKSYLDAHGSEMYAFSRQKLLDMKNYADEGNWTWKIAGFTGAVGVVLLSTMSFLSHLFGLSPISAVLDLYLILIGTALAALEYKEQVFTKQYLDALRKEALFLYRPYGRAGVYFFVGVLMISSSGLIGKLVGSYVAVVGGIIFYSSREAIKQLNFAKGTMQNEQEVIAKFCEFDKDHSGSLDTKELAALCKALGAKMTMNEIESALFILDKDANGKIEMEEFLAFWKGRDVDMV